VSETPLLVGVARESLYSPGRFEAADRGILDETGRALEARGARVRIVEPDAKEADFAGASLVFAMCQGPAALDTLRRLAAAGHRVVHEAEAIEACHRVRLVPRLAAADLPRPEAHVVASAAPDPAALAWVERRGEAGVWIKRGDVHATQEGDVRRVSDAAAARAALAELAGRGVAKAVLEAHVPGRTVKFYAVRGSGFFRAYAEDGREEAAPPQGWREVADRAAEALGLSIYGGDVVVDEAGGAAVVDVNDWPSFSRCREEAAQAIAAHLLARLS
jgi:glutathione synthase/RimK-type ligase-like ATP-grasp enzyme